MKKAFVSILVFILIPFIFNQKVFAEESVSANSYVLIEASSGTVLYSKNQNEKREPASTTKILTALIAIEKCDLSSVFKVSKNAADIEGSQLGLEEGDEVSLDDLLHILLMKSGNDAAVAIAENVAGSVDKFADMMNKKASEIGCKNSHFSNPHGLGSESHYTTAYDLALIAAEALRNETFSKIVSTKQYTLAYHNLTISNSNKLLKLKDYFTGVKTGFTKSAGRCLVSSAVKDGVTLVAVTLKDGDDWNDHIKLMEDGFERVEKKLLCGAGEYKVERQLFNGNRPAVFVNSDDIYGVVIDGKPIEYSYVENIFPIMFSPAYKYSYGGYLAVCCNGTIVQKSNLYLTEDVGSKETADSFGLFLYNLTKLLKTIL